MTTESIAGSPANVVGRDAVELHRNRLLYGSLPRSIAASVFLSGSMAITLAFLPDGSPLRSAIWFLSMALVGAARLEARHEHRRNQNDLTRAREFGRRYAYGAAAAGAMWGAGALFLFPGEVVSQAFMGFVFAGISSGAITTLGPSRPSAVAFLTLALVPLALRLMLTTGPLPTVMGLMCVAFLFYLLGSSRQLGRTIDENFRLREAERLSEASLRHQKELLERVGKIAAVGGWRYAPDTDEMEWSKQVYRIFGRDPSLPPDQETALAPYVGEARREVESAILGALEEGRAFDLEVPFLSEDGRSLWVRLQGERDSDSEDGVAIIGTFQDITDRKVAREALAKNVSALERLHRITSKPSLDLDGKLQELLALGLEVFELDLGIVARVEGNDYTIRASRGSGEYVPEPGTVMELGDTYCVHALASDEPVSFHEAGKSEIRTHPCYSKFGLESYIGSPMMVDGVRFGTVAFSAAKPRKAPFSEADHTLMQVFAEWIGNELTRDRFLSQVAESEQRVRLLLESVGEGVYGMDLEGCATFANPAALTILGYESDEFLGKAMHSLIHHSYRDGTRYPIEECPTHDTLRRGVVTRSTEVLWRADGTPVPVELTSTPIRRDGELVGAVVAFRDITRREDYERRLQSTLAMQGAILDSSNYAIIATDTHGVIRTFSRGAERMLDWKEVDVVDRLSPVVFHEERELRAVEESQDRRYRSHFDLLIDPSLQRDGVFEREWSYVRSDGSRLPVLLSVTPVRNDQDEPLGYLFVAADLTERKRVDRLKNEFVSTVSHELRTPLTSIRGSLGLVASGAAGTLPERAQGLIAIASRNSERLIFLINDILDMEKIESGKMEFVMKVQPLQPLVQQAVQSNTAFAAEHGVELTLQMPETPVSVNVDENRMIQVLTNLISNASKFSGKGEKVEIRMVASERRVRISVEDHGPGISEDFQKRVFEKFSQADASDRRAKGGTGLGLSITRALIQQMHGIIDFETEVGKGTTFWIEIPIAGEVAGDAEASAPAGEWRLLLCSADADGGAALQDVLDAAGYHAEAAASPADFRLRAERSTWDAFLIDLTLAEGEGLKLVQWIRERPQSATTPVLAVSARVEEDQLAVKGNFPVLNLLARPIDSEVLLDTLRRIEAGPDGELPRVLHVEDDPDLQQLVSELGRDVARFHPAGSLAAARKALLEGDFQLILLDIGLPDGSGWELLRSVQKLERRPPVVVFSATPVGADQARKVEATLLKSHTSESDLLATLRALLTGRPA